MDRSPDFHRKILLTALVVALAAAVSGFGTNAAFTGETRNDPNAFAMGTVELTTDDGGSSMFSLSEMRPTDAPASRCVFVTYRGSVDATVRLYADTSGDLPEYLDLTVERGSGASFGSCGSFTPDPSNYLGKGEGVIYAGTLEGFPPDYDEGIVDPTPGAPETWTASESHAYRFTIGLQSDLAARGLSGTATFIWEAESL